MLPPNLSVGGWNTVFVATLVLCALYGFGLFRRSSDHDTKRLLLGFSLICLGVSIRIGGWFPWRSMLEAKNAALAAWWRDLAPIWTGGGAVLMVLGMTILMWPALKRFFGRFVVVSVVLIEGAFYLTGVALTKLVSSFL